nr:hypothetical protein [uncultured organism]
MRHSPFINWLARILLGLGVAAISLQVGLIFWRSWWQVGAVCAAVAVCGIAIAVHAELRERRRRLLKRANAELSLPTQWSVKFDKRLPGGWTAPIAVMRDDGMRFVVDIQPFRSATWSSAPRKPGVSPWLVDAKDRPLRPDPVTALAKGALAASAAPVLWLPRAEEAGTSRHPDTNLVVVSGSARDLKLWLQSARRVTANATPPKDTVTQDA